MAGGQSPALSPAVGRKGSTNDGDVSSMASTGGSSARHGRLAWQSIIVAGLSVPQRVLCILVSLAVAAVAATAILVLLTSREELRASQESVAMGSLVKRVSSNIERQTRATQTLVANMNRQMGAHYTESNATHISVELATLFDSTLAALTIDQGDAFTSTNVLYEEASVLLLGFSRLVKHEQRAAFEAQLSAELNATRLITEITPAGLAVAPDAESYSPITIARPPLLAGAEGLNLGSSPGLPELMDGLDEQLQLVSWNNGAFHLGLLPAYRPPNGVAAALTNLDTPSPGVVWPLSPSTREEREERLVGWSWLVMNVSVSIVAATRDAEALLSVEASSADFDYSVVDAQSVIRAAELAGEAPPEAASVCSTDEGVHAVFESVGHVSSEPLCFPCDADSDVAGDNHDSEYYDYGWVNACATLHAGGSTFIFRARALQESIVPVDETARAASIGVPVAVAVVIWLLVIGILGNMVSSQRARLEHNKRVAAVKLQMGFESTMSYACHELRNPLHVASSCLEFVMEYMDSLAPEVREDLTNMASAIAAMRMLVDDILDVSKLRTGAVSIVKAAANIRNIATRAVDEHRTFAVVPIVCSIEPSVPTFAVTDGMRLRQILANGISNAAKHTSRGQIHMQVSVRKLQDVLNMLVRAGHVPASAADAASGDTPWCRSPISAAALSDAAAPASKQQRGGRMPAAGDDNPKLVTDEYVEFKVSDTGLGLRGEDPDLLFQPYRQGVTHAEAPLGSGKNKKKTRGGESATARNDRAMRGTGLGLSICRMLARAMGGEATLADRLAVPSEGTGAPPAVLGADFTVILPLQPAEDDFPISRSGPVSDSVAEAPHSETVNMGTQSTPATVHEGHEDLPYHVIIVDDMRANRRLGTRMAESLGWTCAVLEDGDEVVDYLRSHHRHVLKTEQGGARVRAARGTTAADGQVAADGGVGESKASARADEFAVDVADGDSSAASTPVTGVTLSGPGTAADDAASNNERPLHAILLDIVMARQSGVATCKQLRSCGVDVPVIAATGNAASSDVQTYIAAGFNAVLHKPFNRTALQRVVKELVDGEHAGKP